MFFLSSLVMRPATGLTSRTSLPRLVLADYIWVIETGQGSTCTLTSMFTLGFKHSHSVHKGPAQTISMTVTGNLLRKTEGVAAQWWLG